MTPLAQLYERMYFIRRFEESLLDLFAQGKLVGTTHTYIGQEANAVGIIDHLEPERDVDLLESPLPRPLPRVHRRRLRPALRGDGQGAGCLRRQGRQPAPVQGQLLLERRPREHRPRGHRHRARGEAERDGGGLHGLSRRRHAGRGRDLRVAQHRLALEAARALRRREQPLRAVDAGRARARRLDSRAGASLRRGDRGARRRRTSRRSTTRPGAQWRGFARPARRSSSCSTPIDTAPTRRATTTATRPRSRSAASEIRSPLPARGCAQDEAARIEDACERRLTETIGPPRGRAGRRWARSPRPREALRPGPERGAARGVRRSGRRLPARRGHPRPVRRRLQGEPGPERRVPGPGADDSDLRGVALRRRRGHGAPRTAADPRDHVRGLHRPRPRPDRQRHREVPRDVRRPGHASRSSCARRWAAGAATGRRTASRSRSSCSGCRTSSSSRRASATTCASSSSRRSRTSARSS